MMWQIDEILETEWMTRDLNVTPCVVYNIWKQIKNTGSIERKTRSKSQD